MIFISHQWLGTSSPDPRGQQLSVMRDALQHLEDGSLRVEPDLTSWEQGKGLTAETYRKVAAGYVFFDALARLLDHHA